MKRHILAIGIALLVLVPHGTVLAAGSCQSPITFRIGSIDPRFAISLENVQKNLAQAEAVWEAPSQKNLFDHATTGAMLAINFVYDKRQEQTNSNKAKIAKLALVKAAFGGIQDQFAMMASTTKAEQQLNENELLRYRTDEATYNQDVAKTNAKGGATKEEYVVLNSREADLSTRFLALKTAQNSLNLQIDKINTLATSLDTLAKVLNSYIDHYNKQIAGLGNFEEGLYSRIGASRTITIFEFADDNQLVRVLAHELGHAMDMDHVSDPQGIMYATNQGVSLVSTAQDMTEFYRICGR